MQDGPEQHKAVVPAQDEAPTSYSRRATLILLGSIGVTLLVTGATGSRMLKRATPKPNPAPSPVPSAPISFPKRSPRRLKDLFAITSATLPNDETVLSKLDFRTNQQFTKSLPVPTTSTSFPVGGFAQSEVNSTANEEDPAMGAILDAIKAFGIATFILVGGTGVTAYLLARRFESTDLESFMRSLRSELMQPFAKAMEPPLPEWLRQKPRNPEDEIKDKVEEQELRNVLSQEWQDLLSETSQAEQARSGRGTAKNIP